MTTSLVVPPAARLHFAVTALARACFRATAGGVRPVPAEGDGVGFRLELDTDSEHAVPWERFVGPDERDRFHEATVSLAPWSGRSVRLTLTSFASADGEEDRRDDHPFVCRPFLDVAAAEPPPNVLLIVLDTVRADALGCYGNDRDLTPHLDRLAEEGCLFEHARSPAGWTLPSHCSLFTSLLPPQHGVLAGTQRLSGEFPTLAGRLAAAGYRTAAFTDGGYVSATFGLGRGFRSFDARGGGAEKVFERAARWMATTRGPLFAFVQTYEAHMPYRPPEPERSRWVRNHGSELPDHIDYEHLALDKVEALDRRDARHVHDVYEAGVAYLDRCLGRFLAELRARSSWENTLVIVTSDHGEEFGEHGSFRHGATLYEPLLRVPLIVRWPGRYDGGRRSTYPVRLVDIAPTILDVVGLAPPADWVGVPLDRQPGRRDLLATRLAGDYAIVDPSGRYKWLRLATGPDPAGGEMYDLRRDPGERVNLWDEKNERLYESMLDDLLGRYTDLRRGDPSPAAPTPEEQQVLRGLGYVR